MLKINIKYACDNSNTVGSQVVEPTMWVTDDAAFDAAKRKGRDERAEGDWNYHSHTIGPSVRRVAFRARLKEPIDHHRRGPKGLMFSRGCGVSAIRYRDLGTEQEKEQGGPSVRRVAFRARLKEPIDHHRRGPKGLMFSRGCGVSAIRYRDLGTEQEKEQGGF
ncbi:unnamed protein product [Spodoptera exigua]|nr:unnamed protein product [Spodoptera exigua]